MKLFIVAFILPFVFCDGCEEFPPVECAEGEERCPGGLSSEGCPWQDYCITAAWPTWSDTVGDTIMCPGICYADCNWETEVWCDNGVDEDGCWMGDFCLANPDGTAMCPTPPSQCPYVEPVTCGEAEFACWGGLCADGCPHWDYCIPAEYPSPTGDVMCPGVCSAQCDEMNDLWCDNGEDANGCWMGNWCMPNPDGTAVCPTVPPPCPQYEAVECCEGEITCWGGEDENHCPYPDYCVSSTYKTWDGIECPQMCPWPCHENELYCDNGYGADGCWWGNHCLPMDSWDDCPVFCPAPCDEHDLWCDNGMDENGCWLGNFCLHNDDGLGECPLIDGRDSASGSEMVMSEMEASGDGGDA